MARDHRKLRVFHDAHHIVLAIYQSTNNFPRDELFGLRAQLRRASVSITTNLVEGSARGPAAEYVNFVNVARGSAAELGYLIQLSAALGFLDQRARADLEPRADRLTASLEALARELRLIVMKERMDRRRPSRRPKA